MASSNASDTSSETSDVVVDAAPSVENGGNDNEGRAEADVKRSGVAGTDTDTVGRGSTDCSGAVDGIELAVFGAAIPCDSSNDCR